MAPTHVLLVDDELAFTEIMAQRLAKRGYDVQTASDGKTALDKITEDLTLEVVVLDIAMPGMDGMETLKAIKRIRPLLEVVMLTGHGTVNTAVESIKWGAYNYLTKPCDLEDLVVFIEKAVKHGRDREARVLEVRMTPYLTKEKREELIAAILKD